MLCGMQWGIWSGGEVILVICEVRQWQGAGQRSRYSECAG